MLYVTSLDGLQVEPLINFNSFEMKQDVNGAYTVSLTSFSLQNPAHQFLTEESIITVDDYDFRVKQLEENQLFKKVTAISTFFDLNDVRQDTTYAGTHTFNEFATFTLQNTGWFFTSDVTGSKLIPNFGNGNVISLINTLCSVYNCEYEIKQNNHVHFSYEIGGDNDAVYRYKHNVKALSKQIDTTKLKTFIEGYGANGLYVSYESPNSSTFGIRKADPIIDDGISESATLLEKIKNEIIDYPEASFVLDSVELVNKELGERVHLIYEPLKIELETRVLSQIKEFRNGQLVTTKVTLGNVIPKTTHDLLVSQKIQIDENKKEYRSKFEQTNDRITLEVEQVGNSITSLNIRADGIESSVTNLNTNLSSKITQTASEIRSEVSAVKSELEGDISTVSQTASQIQSTVTSQGTTINSLGTRIGNAESTITQQAGLISSKVTADEAESIFYQTANSFTFDADQINFNGHIFGQGATFSGNISTSQSIDVGNNIYLGGTGSTGDKMIRFRSGANIQSPSGSYDIEISAENFKVEDGDLWLGGTNSYTYFDGTVDFRDTTTVRGVAMSDTTGLGLAYSSAAKRLYVRINGSDVGFVNLT